MAWAKNHPSLFPVNLNRANFWKLIKIPGIGPTTAKKIIAQRQQGRIKSLSQFTGQRFQVAKIQPYITF